MTGFRINNARKKALRKTRRILVAKHVEQKILYKKYRKQNVVSVPSPLTLSGRYTRSTFSFNIKITLINDTTCNALYRIQNDGESMLHTKSLVYKETVRRNCETFRRSQLQYNTVPRKDSEINEKR